MPRPGSPTVNPLVVAVCSTDSSAVAGTTFAGCWGAPAANAVPSTSPATERAPAAAYRARWARRAGLLPYDEGRGVATAPRGGDPSAAHRHVGPADGARRGGSGHRAGEASE